MENDHSILHLTNRLSILVSLLCVCVYIYIYNVISYRWGKPIRLLEVAITAAAADFDETTSTHGTNQGHHASVTGDEEDLD